jgi:hypothetical protein
MNKINSKQNLLRFVGKGRATFIAIFFAVQYPWALGLLFPCLVRVGTPGLFYLCPLTFRLFFLAYV